ncbi:hypothetical protein M3Y97_01147500 [Aphelenchoides bicaudatus]|nr:hypothetical protein M3Y97_01147500 [Aphelenchoides bicaudatus]
MNLLPALGVFAMICLLANAQNNVRNFYSNPLKMLINKYPAYVSSANIKPVPPQKEKIQHPRKILIDPEEITISGERPLDLGKRRRIIAPIRITPFLYSMNPVELDDNKPLVTV